MYKMKQHCRPSESKMSVCLSCCQRRRGDSVSQYIAERKRGGKGKNLLAPGPERRTAGTEGLPLTLPAAVHGPAQSRSSLGRRCGVALAGARGEPSPKGGETRSQGPWRALAFTGAHMVLGRRGKASRRGSHASVAEERRAQASRAALKGQYATPSAHPSGVVRELKQLKQLEHVAAAGRRDERKRGATECQWP